MTPSRTLHAEVITGGSIAVYSGKQRLLNLSAEVAQVIATAILVERGAMAEAAKISKATAISIAQIRKRQKKATKAVKKLKATKKPKKIKAAKPAIKAPPPPFHLARRAALSPSKTNLFRGSVSTP